MSNKDLKLKKQGVIKEQGTANGSLLADPVKMQTDGRIIIDPFGSWTGVPLDDPLDAPVQDVDDL